MTLILIYLTGVVFTSGMALSYLKAEPTLDGESSYYWALIGLLVLMTIFWFVAVPFEVGRFVGARFCE